MQVTQLALASNQDTTINVQFSRNQILTEYLGPHNIKEMQIYIYYMYTFTQYTCTCKIQDVNKRNRIARLTGKNTL